MPILPLDGASVHYLREGTGPAALLLHGIGVIGEGWRPQIDGLSDRYTLIALDNRGIGASVVDTTKSVTIETMARDALAVMDAEGIERFHVCGHSVGALIAQHVALSAPSRIASLALVCPFVRGRDAARLTPALIVHAARLWIGSRRMRRHAFLEAIMPAAYLAGRDLDALADRLARLLGRDLADQPRIVLSQFRAATRYDGAQRWSELGAIPTLVIGGAHDRISRRPYAKALASAIPGARLVELPDAGHGAAIQCPGEVNALLDEHWRASA